MAQQRHFAIVIEDRGNEEAAATIHNRPHADATNFVASNDPPPNIRTIIPKKLAVERAESEIVGHAELLEAVLHDIDSFYTQTGQIATMRASLKVAVASCHAGQSFNQHLPPKSMLLAARYCDFENSIDPILAGNLARLNRLDLAQAGNASCGQPGIECINAQKLSKSQETIQVLKKEVERMGEDTKHLLSEIAILEDLVF
ncbi:hypothetical protein GGS23DRAFT_592928 [Durotheca rogersii]|uniref:uncharacterized protein n=1 Tax=Durotheca rogersii TaxID=419775 RepID=UPI00221FF715|nr:uncharacterized protein GGS23DRAFT_592928 [Durotheca rogersii]KAI5867630.1 hypothetical protein GGS23DRAFT_592928 [Durotheca rogersii]